MTDALADRRREQEALVELAREYVERLAVRLPVVAAAIAGSVARGDFNVWSDVDVVVIADGLPARAPERNGLLLEDAPPRVQPVGFEPEEFALALRRGNRLAVEALEGDLILRGEAELRKLSA